MHTNTHIYKCPHIHKQALIITNTPTYTQTHTRIYIETYRDTNLKLEKRRDDH